ncbi:hypothetical protein [Amycolatopsis minnesotensis]|uniref:Uncharacterized protein n=1 Tax=Amycolatopsis minnesotensis TaxID=337894 RepID=A0ABN2SXJ7_9PSEU
MTPLAIDYQQTVSGRSTKETPSGQEGVPGAPIRVSHRSALLGCINVCPNSGPQGWFATPFKPYFTVSFSADPESPPHVRGLAPSSADTAEVTVPRVAISDFTAEHRPTRRVSLSGSLGYGDFPPPAPAMRIESADSRAVCDGIPGSYRESVSPAVFVP